MMASLRGKWRLGLERSVDVFVAVYMVKTMMRAVGSSARIVECLEAVHQRGSCRYSPMVHPDLRSAPADERPRGYFHDPAEDPTARHHCLDHSTTATKTSTERSSRSRHYSSRRHHRRSSARDSRR